VVPTNTAYSDLLAVMNRRSRQFQAVGVDFRHGNLRPDAAGDHGDEHADGPTADHQGIFTGHQPRPPHTVACHGHRFDQGRVFNR